MTRGVRQPVRGVRRSIILLALSFALGALVDSTLTRHLGNAIPGGALVNERNTPANGAAPAPAHDTTDAPVQRPGEDGHTAAIGTTGAAANEAAVAQLRRQALQLPVQGVRPSELRDTFSDARGSNRAHEAIDIMAARHTPVVAVQDGTVEKLFASDAGGLTIYQFDPSQTFCYYYAHLDGYAEGLREGQTVQRGQVIGYVGSTGNASADAPHLHFAIFRLTPEHHWWQGEPINPYPVLE
jgi:murein DD-endopeptidase MepM/ murein hydrolase activator NlpD